MSMNITGSITAYFDNPVLLKVIKRRTKRSALSRALRPSRGYARHIRRIKAQARRERH